jgi:hypothetical protein
MNILKADEGCVQTNESHFLRRECSTQFQPTICISYRQLLLAQRSASLRSEPEWSTPETPMEIATEMARLVLETLRP